MHKYIHLNCNAFTVTLRSSYSWYVSSYEYSATVMGAQLNKVQCLHLENTGKTNPVS